MQIKAVIRYLGPIRVMHDTTFCSLSDIFGASDGRTDIILCCETDIETIKYYDLSALINSQPIWCNDVRDWTTLSTYLNRIEPTILQLFEVHCVVPEFLLSKDGRNFKLTPNTFLSDQSKQLRIWSLDNNNGVSIHLGYHKYPGLMDKLPIAHTLNDIVMVSSLGPGKINLKNSIPVVNGIVCYPCFDQEDRMYAVNGKFYLKKRNPNTTNSLLIDFSPLGELTTVKLSDCTKVSIEGFETSVEPKSNIIKGNNTPRNLLESECDNYYGAYKDIEYYNSSEIKITFDLPDGVIGVPIVSIFGRIFTSLYDKVHYQIEENHLRVVLKVKRSLLYHILATNMMKSGQILKNSSVYQTYLQDNLEGLFEDKDEFLKDYYASTVIDTHRKHRDLRDLCVPFVAVVKTNRKFGINFQKPIFKIDNENLMFKPNSGGLLINTETLEIVDYVKIPFFNGTLCTFFHQYPLYHAREDNLTEHVLDDMFFKERQKMFRTHVVMDDVHDSANLALMDFFYETEPGEKPTSDNEVPDIPEPEEGKYVDLNPAELLLGYDKLIAGSRATVNIVQSSQDTVTITGILDELCGVYKMRVIEPELSEKRWYLLDENNHFTDWCLYMKNNFWCIGNESFDPIYQSSDAGRGILPWYSGYLAWFVGDEVNLDPENDTALTFKYVSLDTLDVPTGRGGITGTYHLLDDDAKFTERIWGHNNHEIIYYDSEKNVWVIAKNALLLSQSRQVVDDRGVVSYKTYYVVQDYGTRVYESSIAMRGSSPWHHLAYAYLLEE